MSEESDDLGEARHLDVLLATLGPVAGLEIADIGCGEGELSRSLARAGASVTGIDPHMEPSGWEPQGEGRFRLLQARADALPLEAHSLDVVVFMFSLHHVPAANLAKALADVCRVLRPSGRLYVAEPVPEGPAQYVMELFHDESTVRAGAQAALRRDADPRFAEHRAFRYRDPRTYSGFDQFAERMIGNIRFNPDYSRDDVLAAPVRGRFEEMMKHHHGRFDQPVRVDFFCRPDLVEGAR